LFTASLTCVPVHTHECTIYVWSYSFLGMLRAGRIAWCHTYCRGCLARAARSGHACQTSSAACCSFDHCCPCGGVHAARVAAETVRTAPCPKVTCLWSLTEAGAGRARVGLGLRLHAVVTHRGGGWQGRCGAGRRRSCRRMGARARPPSPFSTYSGRCAAARETAPIH